MEQMIIALRAAPGAFNRGEIGAAMVPLDAQIEWNGFCDCDLSIHE
jgi:hypothetical protein